MDELLDGTIAPVLPFTSIQSIITISSNKAVNVPIPSKSTFSQRNCSRRFLEPVPSFDCYAKSPSVSIVSYMIQGDSSDGGAYLSVVASCIPPKLGISSHPNEGKITLATIYNSPDSKGPKKGAAVRVSHSCKVCAKEKVQFAAVSLILVSGDLLLTKGSAIPVLLLAIDTTGRLFSCQLGPQDDEVVRKKRLREFLVDITPIVSNEYAGSKYRIHRNEGQSILRGSSGPLMFMNTLTARLENASQNSSNHKPPDTIPITHESNFSAMSSSTLRKSRKRKSVPSKNPESSSDSYFPVRTGGIYVVASCLSGPALPSESAPLVMYLSPTYELSSPKSPQWHCLASTKITGIDHVNVPLKCIVFASRFFCGTEFWESIKYVMPENNDALMDAVSECDEDEGIVLMGFQDGSLRVSIVSKHTIPGETAKSGTKEGAIKLSASRTTTLLEANGEPLLSLHLMCPDSNRKNGGSSLLVGIGEHGLITVISSVKTGNIDNPQLFVFRQSIQCESRIASMHVTSCEFCGPSSTAIELTFLGVHDCGKTLNHRVGFRLKDRLVLDWKDEKVRLPVPAGVSVHSTTLTPAIRVSRISDGILFALSRRSGDVVLFKIDSDHNRNHMSPVINSSKRINGPIMSLLLSGDDSSFSVVAHNKRKAPIRKASPTKKRSTLDALLDKLDSAMKSCDVIENSSSPSIRVTQKSIREIRDASNVLSRHMSSIRPEYSRVSWTINTVATSKPGVVDCTITKNETASTTQIDPRDFSVHVIHSCPRSFCPYFCSSSFDELIPLCYRWAQRSGSACTKVVQGGAVTSYSGRASKTRQLSHTCVQAPSFQPVDMFIALQLRYSHVSQDIGWYSSKSIIRSSCKSELPFPGRAAKCTYKHQTGVVFPFDIGSPVLDFFMTRSIAHETQYSSAANGHVSIRANAEKKLRQWFHDRRHYVSELCMHPRVKEEFSTRSHHSKGASVKQISCCSRSIHLLPTSRIAETLLRNANANAKEKCCISNEECGAFSLVIGSSDEESAIATNLPELKECYFAVGSIINLGETMSSLSAIRHFIIRQLLGQKRHDGQQKNRPLELILIESYRSVLANKKTWKIANHVKRSSVSLQNSISNCKTVDEVLSAALALYDIMRTIVFVFN